MRTPTFFFTLVFLLGLHSMSLAQDKDKNDLNALLDQWHKDAADANFEGYFGAMAEESIFVGTDATENWDKKAFQAYSKPYFDRGRAWSFTAVERNIYLQRGGKIAWFDELLSTQMGLCRGSGVLEKSKGEWKIRHYVLSLDVPNENVSALVALKKQRDSIYLSKKRN